MLRLSCAIFLGLLTLSSAFSVASAQDVPRATVDRLHESLIFVMREAETLGFSGRRERLDPALREAFDFQRMARITLGAAGRKLETAQQAAYAEAFAAFSIATYARRFDGYDGERFETRGTAEGPRGSKLVETRLYKSDGQAVRLDYLLDDSTGAWRIVDVFLNGEVSEIAAKRAEFSAVIRNEGFTRLMELLQQKIAEMARSR